MTGNSKGVIKAADTTTSGGSFRLSFEVKSSTGMPMFQLL